jgi:hypothetical protein
MSARSASYVLLPVRLTVSLRAHSIGDCTVTKLFVVMDAPRCAINFGERRADLIDGIIFSFF